MHWQLGGRLGDRFSAWRARRRDERDYRRQKKQFPWHFADGPEPPPTRAADAGEQSEVETKTEAPPLFPAPRTQEPPDGGEPIETCSACGEVHAGESVLALKCRRCGAPLDWIKPIPL